MKFRSQRRLRRQQDLLVQQVRRPLCRRLRHERPVPHQEPRAGLQLSLRLQRRPLQELRLRSP
jgi:hypothetical protein